MQKRINGLQLIHNRNRLSSQLKGWLTKVREDKIHRRKNFQAQLAPSQDSKILLKGKLEAMSLAWAPMMTKPTFTSTLIKRVMYAAMSILLSRARIGESQPQWANHVIASSLMTTWGQSKKHLRSHIMQKNQIRQDKGLKNIAGQMSSLMSPLDT